MAPLTAGEEFRWRGLIVADLRPLREGRAPAAEDYGVRVIQVETPSPAEEGGLQVNDVIDELNRTTVKNLKDFVRAAGRAEGSVLLHTNRGFFVLPKGQE